MSRTADRPYLTTAILPTLSIGMMAFSAWMPSADAGCVVGNTTPGSECEGGNTGQAGGGIGRDPDGPSPCGQIGDARDTLNNRGNVPGCTSVGNAVKPKPALRPVR